MAGYIGSKTVNLSTTGADIVGDADVSGDLTVDTNTLHVDSTNNRVGIGTTSPSAKLQSITLTGTNAILAVGADTDGFADVEIKSTGSNGASRLYFSDTAAKSGLLRYSHNTDSMEFTTNGAERMRIDSSGNVGIAATSPSVKIDVVGSDTIDSNANTSARFRASLTSGADAGVIIGSLNGNTPFIGTDGGNASSVPLTFKTENTERMRIDSSGNLMVGGTSYSGQGTSISHPDNSGNFSIFSGSGTGFQWRFGNVSNGVVGSITTSTSATSYNTSSDYRLKENVTDITGATERLKQLNPVRFNFIADADTTVDGFLAHEVQDVVPEAITGTKDAVDADGNPVYQGIDQSKLVPLLVATIQELEARIAALESA